MKIVASGSDRPIQLRIVWSAESWLTTVRSLALRRDLLFEFAMEIGDQITKLLLGLVRRTREAQKGEVPLVRHHGHVLHPVELAERVRDDGHLPHVLLLPGVHQTD